MDTFNEQIVKMRPDGKAIALRVLIWFVAIAVSTVLIMLLQYVGALIVVLEFLLFWGAIKLTGMTSIEYEYILTNGDLDVDKIVAQSSRKRILTIKCSEVEKVGKYTPGMQLHGKLHMCCNLGEDCYYLLARDKNNGPVCLVFAPGEKMKNAVKTFLPRIIQRDAFTD